MPEPDDNMDIDIESRGINSQNAIVVMEVVRSQPPQEKASKQVVIDLEKDNTKNRKEMEPRSEMWKHFGKVKDDKGNLKSIKCNYCHREMKASTKGHGTSALNKHFNTYKRNSHVFTKDPKQGTLQAVHGEAPSTWRFDQDGFREAFAEMVITDELPFVFGERSGFRKFMSIVFPCFQVPSRRTTTRDIVRHYYLGKARLKKFFKQSC